MLDEKMLVLRFVRKHKIDIGVFYSSVLQLLYKLYNIL